CRAASGSRRARASTATSEYRVSRYSSAIPIRCASRACRWVRRNPSTPTPPSPRAIQVSSGIRVWRTRCHDSGPNLARPPNQPHAVPSPALTHRAGRFSPRPIAPTPAPGLPPAPHGGARRFGPAAPRDRSEIPPAQVVVQLRRVLGRTLEDSQNGIETPLVQIPGLPPAFGLVLAGDKRQESLDIGKRVAVQQ